MKRLVIDLDNTLTAGGGASYADVAPRADVVATLRTYQADGFEIVISTSRNMRTYAGNVGKITANTVPGIIDWLKLHDVPYDEIWVGKPWCGHDGFYVDDRAIRPSEFVSLPYARIRELIDADDASGQQ